jgi:type VI secretion system secreted protein Hcp
MAVAPTVIIFGPDGKHIPGSIEITDPESKDLSGCYGEEFWHHVYTILKDQYYALVYGVDFVRKHEPLKIVKQLDKMSVPLMNYFKNGTFLPKAEIRWYHYNENEGENEEYFRMTLEHVRLHSIFYKMPNVKDSSFERYGHLEELQLMYQKITWHYLKGNLTFTDIWDEAFGEFDLKDFSGKVDDGAEDTTIDPTPEPFKLTFTSGAFVPPKDGFQFDKKVSVKFTFATNRPPKFKEGKLYAKIYAVYKSATEDLHSTQEGTPRENENFWNTEFALRKPEAYLKDKNRAADAVVEYYAEIENQYATNNDYRSEPIQLPKKDAEDIGCIKIKLVTKAGFKLSGVPCSLDENGSTKSLITDKDGIAVWPDVPFKEYNVTLSIGDMTIEIDVPWLRLDEKPFEYMLRRSFSNSEELETAMVQLLLNALGYDCGKIDGQYRPETDAAVKSFQESCGIDVDGIAGQITCQLLLQQAGVE